MRTIQNITMLVGFATVLSIHIHPVSGQVRNRFESTGGADSTVFPTAPRELLRPLLRASRALDQGDRVRAVELLGEVLSNPAPQDYLVPASSDPGTEGVFVSLTVQASKMLGQLSANDRESYRLRYGTQARLMLDQAIEESDYNSMSLLMQRYFYTDAGPLATMLLGHHFLDQGRPVAAENCFQKIVGFEEIALAYEPEASFLLATCQMLNGKSSQARRTLVRWKQNNPQSAIEFSGQIVSVFEEEQQAVSWLQQLIGQSSFRRAARVDQWLMPGGNPARNAQTLAGFPLIQPRWKAPTVNSAVFERQIASRQSELIFLDVAPIPAVQPLAVDNTLLLRGFGRMYGVEVSSGKRIWAYPPEDFFVSKEGGVSNSGQDPPLPTEILTERIWQDAIYGQASSDGQLVFLVPRPGFATKQSNRLNKDLLTIAAPAIKRRVNELKALDVSRQGAIRWAVGGKTGLDEPRLANAFFLGAPLPLEDSLFIVARINNNIQLLELESATGKLRWSQNLVNVDASGDVLDDRFRRLAGATPSYADGVLVCSTGAGSLVGIDLATRSLIWGFQFTSHAGKEVSRISPSQSVSQMVLGGIWCDSSITIADGTVLFTPVDAQNLICIDLATGFPKWKNEGRYSSELPRGDSLFLACVDDGKAILVGRSSVRAVRLSDGFPIWEQSIEDYGRPSGRGYTDSGTYYLPMTGEFVLKLELATGKIAKAVETDGVLGNLICYRGDVISHGPQWLSCYPQDRVQRESISAAQFHGELSPDQLAVKSQLQLLDGDLPGAADSLRQAYEQSNENRYGDELGKLIIEMLKSDFDLGLKLADRYENRLKLDQAFEYNAAKIDGMIRQGSLEFAFDELLTQLELLEQHRLSNQKIQFPASQYDMDWVAENSKENVRYEGRSRIEVRLQDWIASRIQITVEKNDDPQIAKRWVDATNSFLRQSTERRPTSAFEQLRLFPGDLVSHDLKLVVAQRLINNDELVAAQTLLKNVAEFGSSQQITKSKALLAAIFARQRMFEKTRATLQEIADSDLSTEIGNDLTLAQLIEQLDAPIGVSNSSVDSGQGVGYTDASYVHFETEPQVRYQVLPNEVHLTECDDPIFSAYQYQFYTQTGEMEVSDSNGKLIRRFLARRDVPAEIAPVNNYVYGSLRIQSNLGLMTMGTELYVFDLVRLTSGEDPVLWNHAIENGEKDQSSTLPAVNWGETRMSSRRLSYERKVFAGSPTPAGICYLDGTTLFCVDTLTGQPRWRRTDFLPRSMLFSDQENLVVWNSNQREVRVIDIGTGRQLKRAELAPELGALWETCGTKFLMTGVERATSESDSSRGDDPDKSQPKPVLKTVGLYDLLADTFIWKRRFQQETVGCLVRNEQLVVLPREGDIEFIDLADGQTRISCPIVLDPINRAAVDGLGITSNASRHVLHIKRGTTSGRIDLPKQEIRIRNLHYYDTFWTGYLFAVDRLRGKPEWKTAIRFDNFQVAKGIPDRLPFHVLVRRYERKNDQTDVLLQFLFLDLATGRNVANVTIPYKFRNHYWMEWQPEAGQLDICFVEDQLSIIFNTSNDFPPEPTATISNTSSIPPNQPKVRRFAVSEETLEQELERLRRQALAEEQAIQAARKSGPSVWINK